MDILTLLVVLLIIIIAVPAIAGGLNALQTPTTNGARKDWGAVLVAVLIIALLFAYFSGRV